MKESKALPLGFSKEVLEKTFEYRLEKGEVTFGYSKCKFSGKNLGYWITKGNDTNSISNKESFEYLLGVVDPWQVSIVIRC